MSQLLEAMREVGEVDLFAVESARDDLEAGPIAAPGLSRAFVSSRPPFGREVRKVLRWLASPLPRAVLWHQWDRAAEELRAWASQRYDVVWYSHLAPYLTLGEEVSAPAEVVDIDNLEDLKLRSMRLIRRAGWMSRSSPVALVREVFDQVDERRWARRQRAAASSVTRVVVCSELDRRRLAVPGTTVIPNGYEREGPPVGRPVPPASGPVFTMVGLMTYPPNFDAAEHFARDVLPIVRRQLPGARYHIVGRGSLERQSVASLPGVVLRGQVEDIRDELARTDVAVVPIRFGGGTRIKVLESFAHRIPVVATRTGAEGIDATDGEHLLLCDDGDAEAMARGCLRLVQDEAFRLRLVDAAEARYQERYRWEVIRPRVAALIREVADETRSRTAS
ncbi:MAG TPA: glycosyltransferase family 4 protein [Acidimicrobiales bacterium]|nr:glycosyltransferase family 4 protein [Acidimicrobiales bacterium]